MPIRIAPAQFVKNEADRVTSLLTHPRYFNTTWATSIEFEQMLSGLGLEYTNIQLRAIIVELQTRGVIAVT